MPTITESAKARRDKQGNAILIERQRFAPQPADSPFELPTNTGTPLNLRRDRRRDDTITND